MDPAPPPHPGEPPPADAHRPLPARRRHAAPVVLPDAGAEEDAFADARLTCPACGARVDATRERCFACGHDLLAPDAASTEDGLRKSARTIYLLQALSLFLAVPAVGAVALAYLDRGKARGSWLDSHFEWQVDTLWGVFWMGVGVLAATWLGERFLGAGEWLLLATGLPALAWYAHRIVKGWTRLTDGDPVTEY